MHFLICGTITIVTLFLAYLHTIFFLFSGGFLLGYIIALVVNKHIEQYYLDKYYPGHF